MASDGDEWSLPIVDPEALAALRQAVGPLRYYDLLSLFARDLRTDQLALADAVTVGDFAGLRRICHRLRGALGTFGAIAAHKATLAVEA